MTATMMTPEQFWTLVDAQEWSRDHDYNRIKKALVGQLSAEQADALSGTFAQLKSALYKALDKAVEGYGGDSYDDLLSHIIGLGKAAYEATLANPELGAERARKGAYEESFAYAVPSSYDYENLELAKYLQWARDAAHAHVAVFDAPNELVPDSWADEIEGDALALVDALKAFYTSKDYAPLLAQESNLKAAAERVDAVLSRLDFGCCLFDEGTIEDRLRYAANKWAVWNLLSDLREWEPR